MFCSFALITLPMMPSCRVPPGPAVPEVGANQLCPSEAPCSELSGQSNRAGRLHRGEPGSLVGAGEYVLPRVDRPQLPSLDQSVEVDVHGPGEWIVGVPSGEHSLHVFRLAPGDWLVSEVGQRTEGRATDLSQAIIALSAGRSSPEWWSVVPRALDGVEDRRDVRE
jgi:hypothetical protein